ncbi:hypothetical protein L596_013154 [Steinernema carpocapsae]|uniref:Uncharacterized protein n=1 Tax=Steinernema carpocapsae TaxID=34508 RepID=A0A4U5NZB1_STECR|nr:hypothetical protein L596_013154 [Steinernema carpocapsae]
MWPKSRSKTEKSTKKGLTSDSQLVDVKLEDFLLFLCPVVNRCKEFLKNANKDRRPLFEKLEMALQFKLHSTLTDVIGEMTVQELKNLHERFEFPELARNLVEIKLCLIQAAFLVDYWNKLCSS